MKTRKVPLQQYAFETKYLDGDNEDFLEESAPLIGYVVFNFNTLEETLTSFICKMISDRADGEGLVITHNLGYSAKVDLFDRYSKWVQSLYEKELSLHNEMIKQLRECGKLRNMVVHAEWETCDLDGYALVRLKFGAKGIEQEYVQFSVESLKKIQKLIKDTTDLFEKYEEEFFDVLN
jgi:hypothetical protein